MGVLGASRSNGDPGGGVEAHVSFRFVSPRPPSPSDTTVARTEGLHARRESVGVVPSFSRAMFATCSQLVPSPSDTTVARTEGYTHAAKVWVGVVPSFSRAGFCRPVLGLGLGLARGLHARRESVGGRSAVVLKGRFLPPRAEP
jgi:hypothetical protein